MELLGIRFCSTNEEVEQDMAFFEKGLGLKNTLQGHDDYIGAIFPTDDQSSWVEMWQASEQMPSGLMLQLVVSNADEMAEHAKANGLQPHGPVDAHGERIYYIKTPSGLSVSFQSKLD